MKDYSIVVAHGEYSMLKSTLTMWKLGYGHASETI